MLNIKEELKKTGLKVELITFKKPPELPYIVFLESQNVSGVSKHLISNREITIELYSGTIDILQEKKIENILIENSIEFSKSREWIDSERMYQTVYDFTLLEKVGGNYGKNSFR